VIAEQKKLEKKEEVILAAVAIDEKEGEEIQTAITAETTEVKAIAKEHTITSAFRATMLSKAKKHEFIFPLIVITGVVLVWRGLWGLFDQLPIVSYSAISLILGIVILWIFNRIKSL